MSTLEVLASNSGYVWAEGWSWYDGEGIVTYAELQDASKVANGWGGYYVSDGASGYVGQYYSPDALDDGFYIERGCLVFDTSLLPADAIISSAVISLYGEYDFSDTDFNIVVVSGADLEDTLVAGDYAQLVNDTVSRGSMSSADFILEAYNDISLNATGISEIVKAGTTRFALRSSRDISATTPELVDNSREVLRPTAAGDLTGNALYPNTGEVNWQDVDETTPDEATTYISKSAARSATATATVAFALVDTVNNYFYPSDVGRIVFNVTDSTSTTVTAFVSSSQLTLSANIFTSGETYSISVGEGKDLYNIADSGVGAGTIKAVIVSLRIKGGGGTASAILKTGGTQYTGGRTFTSTGSWYTSRNVWTTNPKTGIAWTWTDVNDLQVGVNLQAGVDCTQVWAEVVYGDGASQYPEDLIFYGSNAVSSKKPKLTITIIGTVEGRHVWVEGTGFHYFTLNDVEKTITGTDTLANGTADGQMWVEGTYLHYIDASLDERRTEGTLDGATGKLSGHIWIEGDNLRYIDASGDERYIAGV